MTNTAPAQRFWSVLTCLMVAFARTLYELFVFAVHSGLYSYVLLVPGVSFYLVWQHKKSTPVTAKPLRCWFLIFSTASIALLFWYGLARFVGQSWLPQDRLSLLISAWALLILSARLRYLDTSTECSAVFPFGFLIFTAPLPIAFENILETFLQHGSAFAARMLFKLAGMTYFYENLTFHLPAFNMHVAPECSGIHSSIVLFITSAAAGHLFLRSPWKQAAFMLAVIPLGLLRNGFRVFVLGELCVRIGPEMSDSWIHHHGGPLFFALSLVPLFLLLRLLVQTERPAPVKSA